MLTSLYNYLVPAAGATHGMQVSGVFSATPFPVDFRAQEIDGDIFVPSGVFIDNSLGAGDLTITVSKIGYSVVCPAATRLQIQYPAPSDQEVTITGNGQATVVFVDFPVIPFSQNAAGGGAGGPATIANGADIAEGNTNDAVATSPFTTASVISLLKYIATKTKVNPATSMRTDVAGAAANTTILAANPNRLGATIFNDSSSDMSLLLNSGVASATNRSLILAAGGLFTLNPGEYTGAIQGIWTTAIGSARITEFTA